MHPEQQLLFDLGTIDFVSLVETKERIMGASRAISTLRAYASGWKAFEQWCGEAGRASMPAMPATLREFAAWCINQKFRLETINVRMNAIAHYHREAGCETPLDAEVRHFLSNAKRVLKEQPGGKAPVTVSHLQQIARNLSGSPVEIRNRAMILLQFAAGWRRSEVVQLQLSDVKFVRQGLTLWLRSSKEDQEAKGELVGIEYGKRELTCPVRALKQWLRIRGRWEGPLFVRLTPGHNLTRTALNGRGEVLHLALKGALEAIGEDPDKFGSHSLRAGMITAAAEAGASESSIMMRTCHHDAKTLRRYIRPTRIFKFNPLKGVL